MSSIFSNSSAATLLQGSQSSLQASQQIYTQDFQQNASLDEEQAGLTEQTAALNAENAAIEGRDMMGQQAQGYNNSGVLLQGTPMKVIAQTQSLANEQVSNIIAQGQASSNSSLIQANQTLNNGYAALLGQNNSYLTNLAQDKISANLNMVNGFSNDITGAIGFLTGTTGVSAAAQNNAQAGAATGAGVQQP